MVEAHLLGMKSRMACWVVAIVEVFRYDAARPVDRRLRVAGHSEGGGLGRRRRLRGSGWCSKVPNVESVRPRLRTETAVAVLARTDPDEQEGIVLLPELVASRLTRAASEP